MEGLRRTRYGSTSMDPVDELAEFMVAPTDEVFGDGPGRADDDDEELDAELKKALAELEEDDDADAPVGRAAAINSKPLDAIEPVLTEARRKCDEFDATWRKNLASLRRPIPIALNVAPTFGVRVDASMLTRTQVADLARAAHADATEATWLLDDTRVIVFERVGHRRHTAALLELIAVLEGLADVYGEAAAYGRLVAGMDGGAVAERVWRVLLGAVEVGDVHERSATRLAAGALGGLPTPATAELVDVANLLRAPERLLGSASALQPLARLTMAVYRSLSDAEAVRWRAHVEREGSVAAEELAAIDCERACARLGRLQWEWLHDALADARRKFPAAEQYPDRDNQWFLRHTPPWRLVLLDAWGTHPRFRLALHKFVKEYDQDDELQEAHELLDELLQAATARAADVDLLRRSLRRQAAASRAHVVPLLRAAAWLALVAADPDATDVDVDERRSGLLAWVAAIGLRDEDPTVGSDTDLLEFAASLATSITWGGEDGRGTWGLLLDVVEARVLRGWTDIVAHVVPAFLANRAGSAQEARLGERTFLACNAQLQEQVRTAGVQPLQVGPRAPKVGHQAASARGGA